MCGRLSTRLATRDDYDQLGEVTYEAVRSGRSDYSDAQRQAWMPECPSGMKWHNRLSSQIVVLGETRTEIVGFMSLANRDYVDLAHIRPAYQGTGLFRSLFEVLEKCAANRNATRMWVHASITARPAFAAMGFVVVREEIVEVRGQSLLRYEMEKSYA